MKYFIFVVKQGKENTNGQLINKQTNSKNNNIKKISVIPYKKAKDSILAYQLLKIFI